MTCSGISVLYLHVFVLIVMRFFAKHGKSQYLLIISDYFYHNKHIGELIVSLFDLFVHVILPVYCERLL